MENGIQLKEPEFPLTTGHMRFLQLRPEFIFSSLISEFSPQVRGSKTVLDSGFHAVDCEFQLLDSRSYTAELGFRIPIVRGIPDSDSCIPDSKARIPDSTSKNFPRFRILMQKFSGFRNPDSLTWGENLVMPAKLPVGYDAISLSSSLNSQICS